MAGLLDAFKPPPDREIPKMATRDLRRRYRYWRVRQLYATFVGYAVFYFVRKNLPIAMPLMEKSLGITKTGLGLFLTLQDVTYGISKFLNGMAADRANPRYFMAVGLLCSGLMNFAFGMSSALITLGIFWILNGYFQGMGFPPVARVLSHWFSPRERGRFWSIWNTSHMLGAAGINVLAGILAVHYGWRAVFVVPAGLAVLTSLFVVNRLRDTPGSLGLPPVEAYTVDIAPPPSEEKMSREHFGRFLREHVWTNPYIWLVSVANFFVYVVRYGFMNWAPSYLTQVKHVPLDEAGGMVAGFEIAGLVGSVVAGWLTDKYFGSRRGPVSVYYMLGTTACVIAFWKVPAGHPLLDTASLLGVGFLIYGPQFLVGVMAADLATKEAAASAIGLTGIFGYMGSALLADVGLGYIVQHHGWGGGFLTLVACSLAAAVPFALCWNASAAKVYAEEEAAEIRG